MRIPLFNTSEEVESWIEEQGYDSVSHFPDFPQAIIGITTDNSLVYSMQKMFWQLVEQEKMTEEDALEHINYNIIRTLPYMPMARPVILLDLE